MSVVSGVAARMNVTKYTKSLSRCATDAGCFPSRGCQVGSITVFSQVEIRLSESRQ